MGVKDDALIGASRDSHEIISLHHNQLTDKHVYYIIPVGGIKKPPEN